MFKLRLNEELFLFYQFLFLILIFFIIPSFLQLPFRILSVLGFTVWYLIAPTFLRYRIKFILFITLIPVIILHKLYLKTFDFSLLFAMLLSLPLLRNNTLNIKFSKRRIKQVRVLLSVCLVVMFLYLLFNRFEGRPNLTYEINQSGAYLFIFFILSNVFKFSLGRYFVIIASFFVLSRLLILSIVLFYFLSFVKKYLNYIICKFKYYYIFIFMNLLFLLFSGWYVVNMLGKISQGGNDSSRLVNVNDGSNYLRLKTNFDVILALCTRDDDRLFYDGYGDIANSIDYQNRYSIMPHNEFVKSIAQFGFVLTILFIFVSMKNFVDVYSPNNIEYIIPIIVYSLILWVKFTIVPSLEMILILFVLRNTKINNQC